MKFRVWSKTLEKYLDDSEWYVNPRGELFFWDIMDGELIKAPKDSYVIPYDTPPISENVVEK